MNVLYTLIFQVSTNFLTIYPVIYFTNLVVGYLHHDFKKIIACVCRLIWYSLLVYFCVIRQEDLQFWNNEKHIMGAVSLIILIRFSILTFVKIEYNMPLKDIYDGILLSPYKTVQYWHKWILMIFFITKNSVKQMEEKLKILLK